MTPTLAASLDDIWAAAQAALPDGVYLDLRTLNNGRDFEAAAWAPTPRLRIRHRGARWRGWYFVGLGATPSAAIQALLARVRG